MIDRIALIDLDPLVHIIAHRHYDNGNVNDSMSVVLNVNTMIDYILRGANSTKYIMFFQGENHKNFRNDILPEYKIHRKSTDATNRWKPVIFSALRKFGAIELKTIESDDALNILAIEYRKKGQEYIIVENDKDLACIQGDHYNPYRKKLAVKSFTISYEFAKLHKYSQIISGDSTDASADLCGIKGMATKPFVWYNDEPMKYGKAQKHLLKFDIEEYEGEVLKLYVKKYGISQGAYRCYITSSVISLIEKVDFNDETRMLPGIVPIEYTNTRKGLFNRPKINKDII